MTTTATPRPKPEPASSPDRRYGVRLISALALLISAAAASPVLAGGGCASTSYFPLLRSSSTADLALSSDGLQAASQFFEAPQALQITGFSFYAYVDSGPPVSVAASLFLAGADGFPTGAPLVTTTVTVDNPLGSLNSMRHQAPFAGSALVGQDYVLVIANESSDLLFLVTGDPAAGDGQGEGLSSLLVNGTWQNGLDVTVGGRAFDADVLLQPDYVVVDFFLDIEAPSPCLEAPGTLEFNAVASPVLTSRFYNADLDNVFTWTFGDGAEGAGASVMHTYAAVGPWTVRGTGRLTSGQGGSCSVTGTNSFGAIPVVTDISITERFDIFEVVFSTFAVGSEGWLWHFGDGTTSTAQSPRHTYPGIGFYTACVTTFNRCGEIPELCLDVLSPFPDISVQLTSELTEINPGDLFTYTVEVWNFSGAASGPQTLAIPIPEALADASWTCTVDGAGSCTPAGTTSIVDAVEIDQQTILTYTVTGTYEPTSSEPLFLSADVTIPGGDETSNNSAFAYIYGTGTIFADGFETGDTGRWELIEE
ncbi:MAG: PKD domain-containing protein [Acidobacteriota bacterium]